MAASHLRWSVLRTLVMAIKTASTPGSAGLGARFAVTPRMLSATLRGRYPGMSRATLAMMLAGVAYIVLPVDVIPEIFLGVFGIADDAFVLTWIAATFVNSTEDFIAWERGGPQDSHSAFDGQTFDAPAYEPRPGAERAPFTATETVRSHVVG